MTLETSPDSLLGPVFNSGCDRDPVIYVGEVRSLEVP